MLNLKKDFYLCPSQIAAAFLEHEFSAVVVVDGKNGRRYEVPCASNQAARNHLKSLMESIGYKEKPAVNDPPSLGQRKKHRQQKAMFDGKEASAAAAAFAAGEPAPKRNTFTLAEFCEEMDISRSFYHKLVNEGKGPRVMRLGRRVLISAEAAADWWGQMAGDSKGEA